MAELKFSILPKHFSRLAVFSSKFCIFGPKICDWKNFRQPKIWGGGAIIFIPPSHDAIVNGVVKAHKEWTNWTELKYTHFVHLRNFLNFHPFILLCTAVCHDWSANSVQFYRSVRALLPGRELSGKKRQQRDLWRAAERWRRVSTLEALLAQAKVRQCHVSLKHKTRHLHHLHVYTISVYKNVKST